MKHRSIATAATTVALAGLFTATNAGAAGGVLDTTFGSGGIASIDFQKDLDNPNAVVIQPDGKILSAGYAYSGGFQAVGLARMNTNGSPDTTFGTGGKVVTTNGSSYAWINALALMPEGKIIAVGRDGPNFSTAGDFEVLRYFADGSLDPSFGVGGKIKTDFAGFDDKANAVALQADGKIVVAGEMHTDNGGGSALAVARYNVNGTLDLTFGLVGKVTTAFDAFGDNATGVAIQPDGKIVVTGTTGQDGLAGSAAADFVAVRYTSSGALDTTFGTGGKVRTNLQPGTSTPAQAFGMVFQPDGKIVLGGTTFMISFGELATGYAMVRYNINGSLDSTFGTGGIVTASPAVNAKAIAMSIQSDGKLLLAGYADPKKSGDYDLAVERYNSNGSVDTTFGVSGITSTNLGSTVDTATALTVQPDGKIVAASQTRTAATSGDFAVVRYLITGTVTPPPATPPPGGGGGKGGH